MQIPANPVMDERVKDRRQRDLDGWTDSFSDIVDKRTAQYETELKETWQGIGKQIDDDIKKLYKLQQLGDGTLSKSKKAELERLLFLQKQTERLTGVTSQQVGKMGTTLGAQYAESFYHTAFNLEQAAKVSVMAPILTESQVMGVVNNPWLTGGANYSGRLRKNTVEFAQNIKSTLDIAVSQGLSVQDTARMIQEKTGESYNNAVRLARTELNRAAAQGASHSFMQNADVLDGKRWNATLDAKTAPKDGENDGKLYALDYDTPENPGKPGERIPNHPNCRCKWSPVLSALGVNKRRRIAKESGERTYTKARTYEEYAEEKGLPTIPDRLADDNKKSYLRRGETLHDYAEAVGMTEEAFLNTVNGRLFQSKAGIPEIIEEAAGSVFTAAASIAEANEWAAQNIPQVATVDYTGFDLDLANEVNETVYELFQVYPEITGINFIGTSQERNRRRWEIAVQQTFNLNRAKPGLAHLSDEELMEIIRSRVKRPKAVASSIRGEAAGPSWGELAGITYNLVYAKDYAKLRKDRIDDVKVQWMPKGTEAPVSTIVHEFGHSIDYFLKEVGLYDKYLEPVVRDIMAMGKTNIKKELSEYASTKDAEVIAEAFAEYRMSPRPRKLAVMVGKAIDAALDEYRRSQDGTK